MKTVAININLFEINDRVLTPEGEATVLQNEEIPTDRFEISGRMVTVKFDEHPRREEDIDAWLCSLIKTT